MLPEKALHYLKEGLAATPVVIDRLLREAAPEQYDLRPDPERFTLREVMGHLADWEGVWMERAQRILTEENPDLPGYDEGAWAIEHGYARMDVAEQQARFREGRAKLLALLDPLSAEEWTRTAQHSEWGEITLVGLATLVLGHDGYHTRQIAEWIDRKA
jgi:uncharacterized damage-inducible protein DinB